MQVAYFEKIFKTTLEFLWSYWWWTFSLDSAIWYFDVFIETSTVVLALLTVEELTILTTGNEIFHVNFYPGHVNKWMFQNQQPEAVKRESHPKTHENTCFFCNRM